MTLRRIALAGVCLLSVTTVAGCGTPPWQDSAASPGPSAGSPSASTGPTSTASTPVTPSATPSASERNDLATGSLSRRLTAGNVVFTVKYWSTLDLGDWTAAASKPLNLSASASFADDSSQDVYLSGVQVQVTPQGGATPSKPLDPIDDQADVKPGYLVTAPTSYGQVFSLPSVPTGTRSISITLTYQLLIQTAPKSKTYSRQAASDTLVVPLH